MNPGALRDQLGLTRAQLARALGVHERTIIRWEAGESMPSGLAAEVLHGISFAIENGANAANTGRLLGMGLSSLLFHGLTANRFTKPKPRRKLKRTARRKRAS